MYYILYTTPNKKICLCLCLFSAPGAPLPGSATAKQGLTFLSSYKLFIVQSNPVNKGTGGGGGGRGKRK